MEVIIKFKIEMQLSGKASEGWYLRLNINEAETGRIEEEMFQAEEKAWVKALSFVYSSEQKTSNIPEAQITKQRAAWEDAEELDYSLLGQSLINPGQ